MLFKGNKVRIKSGNNEGKNGIVISLVPMGQAQHLTDGQEISAEGSIKLYLIEFENGDQDILGENSLETIPDIA